MKAADAATQVARECLGLEDLITRNSDSLDFKNFGVGEIKAALIQAFKLGQQHPVTEEPRFWYCFDQHDNFGGAHTTVAEAAALVEQMAADGHQGLHMVQMTQEEFLQYSMTGQFPFSNKM